jgi:hypothetical protein
MSFHGNAGAAASGVPVPDIKEKSGDLMLDDITAKLAA